MNKNYLRFFLTLAVGITLLFGVTNAMAGQQYKFTNVNSFLGAFGNPTVSTEKYSYNRGDNVVIVGSGYGKFEQVRINIETYNNLTANNEVVSQWDVYTDFRGQFRTEINFDSLSSVSGTYIVKAFGSGNKSVSETNFVAAPEAIGVDIEHCANGPEAAPIPCNISSANDGYTRGNLVRSKSHYQEDQSVPVRIIATGLTANTQYTVTIGYDFTKGGKYAGDYLTTFNRTEMNNNNPCVGVAGLTCALGGNGTAIPTNTIGIPLDLDVQEGFDQTLGTSDDITQIGGVFSIFGGTFDSVSGYTTTGSQDTDSKKFLTLTFTTGATNTSVVIAYGAHISTRLDWGIDNSAISISGSPYHNFISDFPGANQGNRDLQFGAAAILYPAIVRIIKNAVPNAETDFSFTVTGPASVTPTSFILDDDAGAPGEDTTYSNTQLLSGVTSFGPGNEITVTEATTPGWTLFSITCVEQSGGLGTTADSTTSVGNRNAIIRTQEAEVITCTFQNDVVLAAGASIAGTITDSFGRGAPNVLVRVSDLDNGETTFALTNPFGYYHIGDLQVGGNYIVRVSSKRFAFTPDSRVISLNEDVVGVDFIANPE